MQPIKPKITIEGDNATKVEARKGFILGYNAHRVVWRFGFTPESDEAKAYGVSTPQHVYVRALTDGKIREVFVGAEADLPQAFKDVLRAHIIL